MLRQPRQIKRVLAPTTAAIAWAAVLVQLVLSVENAISIGDGVALGLANYFGYFTVLTNLLVALVLTWPALAPESPIGRLLAHPRSSGTAAAAIIVVGIVYHLLLRSTWQPQGLEVATNYGMHYLVPTLFALHWVLFVPKAGLKFSDLPAFAIYPVGYLVYLLIRGAILGKYPYYFVDVNAIGLAAAARNAAGLVAFYFLVVMFLMIITARQRAEGRLSPRASPQLARSAPRVAPDPNSRA